MTLLLTALLAVAQAPEPWVFYGYHVSDGGDSVFSRYEVILQGSRSRIGLGPLGRAPMPFDRVTISADTALITFRWPGRAYGDCRVERRSRAVWSGTCRDAGGATRALALGGGTPDLGQDLSASTTDVAVLDRAARLLASESAWNRADERVCDDDIRTQKWSLFCALFQAAIDETRQYLHRRPVMNVVRDVVVETAPDRLRAHALRDYNNHRATTFAELHRVLGAARARLLAITPSSPVEDVVRRYVAAFNAKDVDAFVATLDSQVVVFGLQDDSATRYFAGRAAVRDWARRYFQGWPTTRITVTDRIVSDSHVVQRERRTWTTPTGPRHESAVTVYRARHGRLRRVWHLPPERDAASVPPVERPAFGAGTGPVVHIDEAHHNLHTAEGNYWTLAELLRRDGFLVRSWEASFTAAALDSVRVLVIANALARRNVGDWSLPTPSAFTADEIAVLREWVRNGGALLLIADHMPYPGAAADLAKAFGVTVSNGFARDTLRPQVDVFRRSDRTLADHPVTRTVDSVVTFTGSAFRAEAPFEPLLVLRPSFVSLEPRVAWQFPPETPRVPAGGWWQGATAKIGAGRVAMLGEAALFWNFGSTPAAEQNPRFVLNLLRWLAQGTDGRP